MGSVKRVMGNLGVIQVHWRRISGYRKGQNAYLIGGCIYFEF
jgi:hypothetical protein